ncbi:predicted protein [Lichtheimia corymbifera JMRC:FSU:9682]|uniref:Phosphoglycerate mutase-like protein n=1 Tax=Lichtheimia corymbifera JMRC:FSU:9682 TaxID=1263082 RepID=A0A068SAG8_9FUNG|nr:predicted protein [Lichtheimia corymbifera JMRC:FSU:9682]
MLKEIWITRHGYREDWVTPTPHLPTQLSHDPPLSELGLAQAEELGEFLQDKGIQRVYSSPFYRVLQTVSPLIAKTHIPLYIDFSMSEWYGTAYPEYLPPASMELLKSHFPAIDTTHESSIPCVQGPETVGDCHIRVDRAIKALVAKLDNEVDGPTSVLLAGHAASVVAAVRSLVNDVKYPIKAATCSVSKLVRNEDGSWNVVMNDETGHLKEGSQRAWTFSGDVPDYELNKIKST